MTAFTDTWYQLLPDATRTEDAKRGRPLYGWLELLGHQMTAVQALIDRIDYLPPDEGGAGGTSDLVNPDTADLAWLPWLAQLLGVTMPATPDATAKRDAIRYAASGWQAGTQQAIADAARSALTGTRYVRVITGWQGSVWTILIRTRTSETPSSQAVLNAVVSKHAKPAGVILQHQAYSPTRSYVDAHLLTRADWDAVLDPRETFEELGAPTS